ncbi:hypothetical protein Vretimale_18915 [Volvox reticuliferus]|uniref:Uncharacterized protein n=1 Tax=Volvox reticuliferus TaxID=1737510 RepID=A0A8J4D0W0_9CHLO|nr:hypothetical protein Vretifemale_17237 [Volvox reticuliferus]GIM16253.1 hypothetical protein Vretimale_18915 [Volvox reticuliferus]
MIRALSKSRRPCAFVRASGAPTPLRPHRRGKVSKQSSPETAPTLLPRNPADVLADQIQDPILRAAVKEPVAFWGGVFAGIFRLNLDQDPLRTWVERTSSQARAATGQSKMPMEQQR